MDEDPSSFESEGVRAAFKINKQWDALLILMTAYRYPESFLVNALKRLNFALTKLFPRPSYSSAVFVQKSLICFSKYMSSVEGISSVLAQFPATNQTLPILSETDTELREVGPGPIISGLIEDSINSNQLCVFVFGRVLYTTMTSDQIVISELLVANLSETTSEYETVDGQLYCLARHYHVVMVSIAKPGDGLKVCCAMQVTLMKLDHQQLITKMQQTLGKKLTPKNAYDVMVVSGPFIVTQPPFIDAPIFPQTSSEYKLAYKAKATAAEMYEKMVKSGFYCFVDFRIADAVFRAQFKKQGDAFTFMLSNNEKKVDESVVSSIPHMLKSIRETL
ncbi:hypothetical protein GPJ56_005312 [Histomonas meleagridis]|uniref:uncharacterized protein n=1 Tax=Histomonas meleagridis TaxID=135588 RepID=UPI0035595010|nr:hypothetical protein GPJ56_005312 [Histomonas meleagridis]KAH0796292.1 hypothetical protein GO595_010185 [Histomonas meleagridis]